MKTAFIIMYALILLTIWGIAMKILFNNKKKEMTPLIMIDGKDATTMECDVCKKLVAEVNGEMISMRDYTFKNNKIYHNECLKK